MSDQAFQQAPRFPPGMPAIPGQSRPLQTAAQAVETKAMTNSPVKLPPGMPAIPSGMPAIPRQIKEEVADIREDEQKMVRQNVSDTK